MSEKKTDREVMKMVMVALEKNAWACPRGSELEAAYIELREALAAPQPAQEPVARVNDDGFIVETGLTIAPGELLYTTPPQRQPLTDEFVRLVVRSKQPHLGTESKAWKDLFASCKYWLEAAHGIGDKQ